MSSPVRDISSRPGGQTSPGREENPLITACKLYTQVANICTKLANICTKLANVYTKLANIYTQLANVLYVPPPVPLCPTLPGFVRLAAAFASVTSCEIVIFAAIAALTIARHL